MATASAKLHARLATVKAAPVEEQDEFDADYAGPEPQFDAARALGPRLSVQERERMLSMKRRATDDDGEVESHPLPAHLKAATMGVPLPFARTREHGDDLEGLCCCINAAGDTAVVGCQRSKLLVVNTHNAELMQSIDLPEKGTVVQPRPLYGVPPAMACTAVRYISSSPGSQNAAVVLVAMANSLLYVHVSTAKVLSRVSEGNNNINNLVISPDGRQFATAGADGAVRLYDLHSSKPQTKLDHGDDVSTAGHSSSVFGLAWSDEDPHTLVSAGWDRTIQVWDARLGRAVRSIFGPYICGDALDVQRGTVLSGSWRHTRPLELWDLGSGRLRTVLPFYQPEQDACKLYAAGFGRGAMEGYVLAGGSGNRPCFKVFAPSGELLGTTLTPSAVNSISAFASSKERLLGVCCSKGMHFLDLKP